MKKGGGRDKEGSGGGGRREGIRNVAQEGGGIRGRRTGQGAYW